MTLEKISMALGMGKNTLKCNMNKHPDLAEKIADGDGELLHKLEFSLFDKAMGNCKKTISIKHYIFDENGKRILDSEDVREESLPPDVGALVFALTNLSLKRTDNGTIWVNRQHTDVSATSDTLRNFRSFSEELKKISEKDIKKVRIADPMKGVDNNED